MVSVGSYMYQSTFQITQQSTFWHNTTGGYGGTFRLFWIIMLIRSNRNNCIVWIKTIRR